jgi:hypothetical protein
MENQMISLRKELKRMDPNLSESDESFKVALVLLAGAHVGISADKIAKRTGLSRVDTRKLVVQAKKAGIFSNGKIHHGGWFDKRAGGTAFWLDVACVRGWLKRS